MTRKFAAVVLTLLLVLAAEGAPSSGKSYSSGSRTSGKSYSSGSPTRGKSYSSAPAAPSKPPSPSPPPAGRSYSSGKPSVPPAAAPAAPPAGKSYSSGAPSTAPPKSNNKVDQAGAAAQQKLNSKESFQKQAAPAPNWRDPKTGQQRSYTTNERVQVDHIRNTVTHERYVTYETRVQTFYGPYYGRPVVYYSDPFGPFFWLWMLDKQNEEQRAYWYYNHRAECDAARLAELRAKDAQFDARLRRLEAEKHAVDPTYVPADLRDQPELMYNKDYVDAAYNPTDPVYEQEPNHRSGAGAVTVVLWVLGIILTGLLVWFLVWFVFFRVVP